MQNTNDYYVYVYIDPRNYEEFYFGKGRDSRKDAHLSDKSDSEKVKRIEEIKKAGCDPIIRVIARNLSEHDAFLVEKTLLWKLGRQLTNISSGHYSENFRPKNTLHLELSGFDYQSGIYYYNVGECAKRNWNDYKKYGFISGGGEKPLWREAMQSFNKGDIVVAYLKKHGFVGVGLVTETARPIREVIIDGKPLLSLPLECSGMATNADSDDLCEYVAKVKWFASVDRKNAKWKSRSNIFTTTHVRASLDSQPETIAFIETEFNLKLRELLPFRYEEN
jgi:hypothetical protein